MPPAIFGTYLYKKKKKSVLVYVKFNIIWELGKFAKSSNPK